MPDKKLDSDIRTAHERAAQRRNERMKEMEAQLSDFRNELEQFEAKYFHLEIYSSVLEHLGRATGNLKRAHVCLMAEIEEA